MRKSPDILVVDVGGSNIKCIASGRKRAVKFKSGSAMTPPDMMKVLSKISREWRYDAVSIGYPGVVRHGKIMREPCNLGTGWVGFDFQQAFGCPVKIINDAAMQALGGYEGGKMLFLGLGTGLGSALIVNGVIAEMELGHLQYEEGCTYEDCVGEKGRERLGNQAWCSKVTEIVEGFRKALLPDYIVLGGGNVANLKALPALTFVGSNNNAFIGGFRIWQR